MFDQKMKIHVAWLLTGLAAIAVLSGVTLYNSSWIPDYGEAEPLFPVVADFGQALAEKSKDKKMELEDLESLLAEDRFSKLRPYGIVPAKHQDELLVLKINKTFSFRIKRDGHPEWEKDNRTSSSSQPR